MTIEYITLGVYFIILLLLGYGFSKMTKNMSDFVRGGAQGTWWLAGSSMMMAGISAFTFTGNGSAAFSAGPTFLIIYIGNCVSYFIGWLFLAAWYRQTRAYTNADVLRARFGTAVEQFSVYTGLMLRPLSAAIQLWALAMFARAIFGFPLTPTIIVIGIVVVGYSTMGGRWAVMATDFVQGLVMTVITTVVAFLALKHIGGFGNFFSYFTDPRFIEDFKLIKDPGQFDNNRFTLKWVIVIFIMTVYQQVSLVTAGRYLTIKDGKEARKASLFAGILMMVGSCLWFIPPMVARFMHGDEIMASGLDNPAEAAYAFMAIKLLPDGLLGVLIAAMFAATMSSMDTGLNSQAGIIVRNLVPRMRSAFKLNPEISNRAEMLICYISTLLLGVFIVFMAIMFSEQKEFILFDAYLLIGSVIGLPLGFPLLMGLWIKRIPFWSYFVIFGACMIPSLISFYDSQVNGVSWTIQDRAMWIIISGTVATLFCIPMYKYANPRTKELIEDFFKTMRTPVNFAEEIGIETDKRQAWLVGLSSLMVGVAILFLLIVPNGFVDRLLIAGIASSIGGIGVALILFSRKKT